MSRSKAARSFLILPILALVFTLAAIPVQAGVVYTVNGLDPRPPDQCASIKRHDDMANCYFHAHKWLKVISAYKTTPPGSLTYASDSESNAALVREFYQEAVAYKMLGNDEEASTDIFLAKTFIGAQQVVSKYMWSQIVFDYNAWATDTTKRMAIDNSNRTVANTSWAQQHGLTGEEATLVKYRGVPCHIQTYQGSGDYHTETFWYCNSDGSYEESYTFTNGHQTGHYVP